jgi:hypothetical protein
MTKTQVEVITSVRRRAVVARGAGANRCSGDRAGGGSFRGGAVRARFHGMKRCQRPRRVRSVAGSASLLHSYNGAGLWRSHQ